MEFAADCGRVTGKPELILSPDKRGYRKLEALARYGTCALGASPLHDVRFQTVIRRC
jgi:hypothetical protein